MVNDVKFTITTWWTANSRAAVALNSPLMIIYIYIYIYIYTLSGQMGNLQIHIYGYKKEHDVIVYTVIKDTQS